MISYTGSGTVVSTNFTSQTYQIRISTLGHGVRRDRQSRHGGYAQTLAHLQGERESKEELRQQPDSGIVPTCTGRLEGPSPDVRFGSKAGISGAQAHVRFTPNSDRESRLPQPVMSALPPKADMCGALAHVCFGPKADIAPFIRLPDRHAIGSLLAIQCQLLSRS